MAVLSIDLNADLAEECGDDAAMYPQLSSANVCCGEHAGGINSMRVAVKAAIENDVVIGAHIGYADRENFGRIEVDMEYQELYDLATKQLRALKEVIDEEGGTLRYVKPHGALYHRVGSDSEQARAVTQAISDFDSSLDVLIPDTDIIKDACAQHGLSYTHEFFADRAYLPTGQLAPRTMAHSVLEDPKEIASRVLTWLETGHVAGTDGSQVRVDAKSICLHGDTQDAVDSAREIRRVLLAAGYDIKSWMD